MITTFGWDITDEGRDCSDPCGEITLYSAGQWSNGFPDIYKKAVFADDYSTVLGNNIEACAIEILQGVTLTVSSGTTIRVENNLDINGHLVFLSNETGNGELGEFGPNGSINGNDAEVHRYMMTRRSFRMVSPAVTTTTTIKDNWQEGTNNTSTDYGLNDDPNPGFGTHITGSQIGARGFDATQTGNPSMFTVDVALQQFQMIPNTDVDRLTAGVGYLMMVRGDRSIDMNTNTPDPTETIIRTIGKLVVGDQPQTFDAPIVAEDKEAFIMFGNPYQSAVDVGEVLNASTNVNTHYYYVYDPSLAERGSYVTVDLDNNTNSTNGELESSEANRYLQPGQGGQVAALNPGLVTVNFQEGHKAPNQFTATNATGNTMLAEGMLMGKLYTQENFTNSGPIHDAFSMRFAEGNNNAVTPEDAVKPMNFDENMGIDNNGTYLSIERRALPEVGENYPLYSSGYQGTEYVLNLELNGLEDVTFFLNDQFMNVSIPLEQGATVYSFLIDPADLESRATDRFYINVAERLGMDENNFLSGITLSPNPMDNQLIIGNPRNMELDKATIYDLTGRLLKTFDIKGSTSQMFLDVSTLSTATYLIVISGKEQEISKLIIKK